MAHEHSTTRSVIPEAGQLVSSALYPESKADAFLGPGINCSKRLSCSGCITRELCAAIAAPLIKRSEDGLIAHNDIATLHEYGIEVSADGFTICPNRLVTVAIRREVTEDFWVADDDPINRTPELTRIAEALRLATGILMDHLDKDIRI